MMLVYLEETEVAERIHNAWLRTIEKGIHTYDIFEEGQSKEKVGTKEFAEAVAKCLGDKPRELPPVVYAKETKITALHPTKERVAIKRELLGVDVFVYSQDSAEGFLKIATKNAWAPLPLQMISNRGVRVWPEGHPETFCVDQWRLRFIRKDKRPVGADEVFKTIQEVQNSGYDVISTENLYAFDGVAAFSGSEG